MKLGSIFFMLGIRLWSSGTSIFDETMRSTKSFDGTITSNPGLPARSLANSSSLVANSDMLTGMSLAPLKSASVVSPM